jgi:hypothetical protein
MHQRTWSDGPTGRVHRRWPAGKPRVLVEDASEAAAMSDYSVFREAGFEVAVCSGPDGSTACPLVEEGRCELAESADVVLFGLDVDDPTGRAVLHAHLRRYPDGPAVVALRRNEAVVVDCTPGGCTVLGTRTSPSGQARALRTALSGGKRRRVS